MGVEYYRNAPSDRKFVVPFVPSLRGRPPVADAGAILSIRTITAGMPPSKIAAVGYRSFRKFAALNTRPSNITCDACVVAST